VVYPNDHRPSHVHVIGRGYEAVFDLNCLAGPLEIRENYGFSRREIGHILRGLTQANQRAKALEAHFPRAVSAHYDGKTGQVAIHLSSKLTVSFSPRDVEGLEDARPSQLNKIEISPSGFGIHFPAVDPDIYVPALVEGFLGSKTWMASRLGQSGGQSRSKAKKTASRANGKLGGRPGTAVEP